MLIQDRLPSRATAESQRICQRLLGIQTQRGGQVLSGVDEVLDGLYTILGRPMGRFTSSLSGPKGFLFTIFLIASKRSRTILDPTTSAVLDTRVFVLIGSSPYRKDSKPQKP